MNVNFCTVLVKKTFFIHLRKQHSLYYEFCVRAFAENKTIMAKLQTLSRRYVPLVYGTILTPLVSNNF